MPKLISKHRGISKGLIFSLVMMLRSWSPNKTIRIHMWDARFARSILRRLTPTFQKKGLVLEVEFIDTATCMHRCVGSSHQNWVIESLLINLFPVEDFRYNKFTEFRMKIGLLRCAIGASSCPSVLRFGTPTDLAKRMGTTTCECLNRFPSSQEKAGNPLET